MASPILVALLIFLLIAQGAFCESIVGLFWQYAPSPDIDISDEDLSRVSYHVDDEVNLKFLVKAGLPLTHHIADERMSRYLIDLLALKSSTCPLRELTRGGALFGFFPEELENRFGWERIALLRKAALHPFWAIAAQSDRADKKKKMADEAIGHAHSIFGIGVMRLAAPAHFLGAPPAIAFHDLRVLSVFAGKEAQLVVDPGILKKRTDLQNRLFTRITYGYVYSRLNKGLHKINQEAFEEVNNIIEREYERYKDELMFMRDYQEYIRAHRKEHADKGPIEIATLAPRDKKGAAQVKQRFKCFQIRAALKTLQTEGIHSKAESRYARLLQLAQHRNCTMAFEGAESGEHGALRPAVCDAFRSGVDTFNKRYAYMKQLPTVAQSLSLLVHTFSKTVENFSTLDKLDLDAFFLWANRFVSDGEMTACAHDKSAPFELPRAFQGQLRYTASMMQLLAAKVTQADKEIATRRHGRGYGAAHDGGSPLPPPLSCPWGRTGCKVRALVGLQQALWEGSPNAAATMSVFSDHGFVLRRQPAVSSLLLGKSMKHTSYFLFRELLHGAETGSIVPADRLIRFVRPFFNLYGWNIVNGHHISASSLSYLFTASEISSDDENGESESNPYAEDYVSGGESTWGLSTRIATKEMQAYFLMMGIAPSSTRTETAECHLLSVLRELGYLCDVRQMSADPRWAATLQRQHAAVCHEQRMALAELKSSASDQHVLCDYNHSRPLRGSTTSHFYTPPRRAHFDLLQKTLLDLAYFYLLNGQQYDLVALYAHLSLKLSSHSLRVGLRLRSCGAASTNDQKAYRVIASKECRVSCQSNWACKKIVKAIPWNVTNVSSAVPSLFHTTFFRQEAFTLLALSALFGKGQDQSNASPIAHVVEQTFNDILGCFKGANNDDDDTDTTSTSDKAFLLLLAAAQLASAQSGIRLDAKGDPTGVREPFALLTVLLTRRKKDASGQFVYPFEHLHEVYQRSAYGWKLDRFLVPRASDTRGSYLKRILHHQKEKHGNYEVELETIQQGLNKDLFIKRLQSHHVLPPFFQDPTYTHNLLVGKQYTAEKVEMRPLLYFSDLQAHYGAAKQTRIERWGAAMYDALLYLFTETKEEMYVRVASSEVMPPAVPHPHYLDIDDVPPFVSTLLDLFQGDPNFQSFAVALLLSTRAFETSGLQGFSLIFHEVLNRQNRYLGVLAHALAREVWPVNRVASIWYDHHLTAQWNLIKPKTNHYSVLFSLRTKLEFGTFHSEGRQEWMSLLFRFHAAALFQSSAAKNLPIQQREAAQQNRTGEQILSLCTGLFYYLSTQKNASLLVAGGAAGSQPVEKFFYDGMSLPVGDTQCAVDLYTHWKETGRNSTDVLQLLRTLEELNRRRALYYRHTSKSVEEEAKELRQLRLWRRFHHVEDTANRKERVEPYFSIEAEKEIDVEQPGTVLQELAIGEGIYYFKRLQTITGVRWATYLIMLWERVTSHFL